MNEENKKQLIKDAIKEYRREEEKIKKDRVYHNTELLLKNYNLLKQHTKNAIYKLEQIDVDISELDYESDDYDSLYIKAILSSKIRTVVMLEHIDMALDVLRSNYQKDNSLEKFKILIELFLNETTYEDVAEQFHCNTMTVRRWKNESIRKLSVLLFGQDGLLGA